jgi:two-component system, NtrC family, response regulator HydG
MHKILVVDDEAKLGKLVAQMLEADDRQILRALNGNEAFDRIASERFDLVITDVRMPGRDGMDLLRTTHSLAPDTDVILMTAFGSADAAVQAMREGAADYLLKPFAADELRIRVTRLLDKRQLEGRARSLQEKLGGGAGLKGIVARSPQMQQVVMQIKQVAGTAAKVLLLGPSGSGKTLLARAIHALSPAASGPLVEVHCAALPPTLVESELFGHEKGAFTGATEARAGYIETAARGTLFLDEIGELDLAVQVKLLRFLQDGEVVRVGGQRARRVEARVVAATNRDLELAVKEGTFREDLFYRLNVFPIRVPPLRDRPDDIPELVAHAMMRCGADPARVTAATLEGLQRHDWPGNVRELENVLERAMILAGQGPLRPEHLPQDLLERARPVIPGHLLRPGFSLDQFEHDLIREALAQARGNKTAAARLLGITRRRLYSRLASLSEEAADDDEQA